jgi:Concanavalin A-like lectin/glucanases superfamily/Abnormal spindle-like microcephaly-assoc'd, ASPM-SPD-2-Hydin/Immunoglobulin domain
MFLTIGIGIARSRFLALSCALLFCAALTDAQTTVVLVQRPSGDAGATSSTLAYSFTGTNAYVEAANSSSLNPGTAATFSAWVNVAGTNGDISSVINKWSQTIDDEYLFGLDANNRLTFAWQTTGGNVWGQPSFNIVTGTAQIPLSTWTYITVVRNGPAISFYINGNLDATFNAADGNPFRSGINTLRIGGQNRGGVTRVLNGMIDEVRIYSQALTPVQIQNDMNAPIINPSVPPSITIQPAGQSVVAGQAATFSVAATGTAPLSYQWQKNGATIAGAFSSSYTTPATTTTDSGSTFTVVVSNSVGTATSSAATLTVNAAPVAPAITVQPASQTVTAGQAATFTVTATGTAPLNYQWYRTGTLISGAVSASYSTAATTSSDNGAQFTVVVSNAAGTVTSSAATLTVNAPQISVVPANVSFGNVVMGITNTQTIVLTNSGSANLIISQASVSGSGFSTSGLTLPLTLSPGQSANFNIAFAPAAVGSVSGNVSLVSNAASSPTIITLSGNGLAATLLLTANPTTLSFGNVNLGSSSTLPVTLTNTGNSAVTIASVTVTGTEFSTSGLTPPVTLTTGQSAPLNVVFAPTTSGGVSGSIAVVSNATNSPATITLSGSAHSVDLSWTASTSVVTGYNVYRGTTSGGPYLRLNTSLVPILSYTDSTVQSGQTYFYVVTAVDSNNIESVFSNEISGTIPIP